ncbi:recombinase family protein [Streptomyces sp. NPDC001507]|uniref:recombinase family protein n=1 Tax=Streptomyces sp. NPDC001507 TaxID=3364579 RepID=UPI00368E7AA6
MADPDRIFDAVVIGSSERAFYGNQFATMAPLFDHYGIEVWVPELGGAVDPQTAGQEELMILLGILSKREIARARIRVRAAMTVQTRDQGRYLGGRPPYGYRLVDAGPHPNRALARRGVRMQRLDVDPECGPIVSWIFAQRLAGHSIARTTRALNDAGIPCPAAADPVRNPHRNGQRWVLNTVRSILANPRYTGRQVWNRQRTDHDLVDPANTTLGHRDVLRWNTVSAAAAWSPTGLTTGLATGAATATPAPPGPTPVAFPTPTCAKTRSCRICRPCTSASPAAWILQGRHP